METRNYLGIYLGKESATVVCVGLQEQERKVLGCFSIQAEKTEGGSSPGVSAMANLIAQRCAEKGWQFSEIAVALDCAMFMQHSVHSDFADPRQIASTIRFDTEEALAADIAEAAIAFGITSTDKTGSQLAVFTTQRKVLSEVITSLQSNNIDPAVIEPDVNCLSRFISRNISPPENRHPFFGMFSRHRGYFIIPMSSESQKHQQIVAGMRTFLIGAMQDRNGLLAREIPVTLALLHGGEPIDCLKIFDSTGSVNCQQLTEKTGIEANPVDVAAAGRVEPQMLSDCDAVEFAIAYGAALANMEKTPGINFRSDFMPYMGRKLRLQKALKLASISAAVLMFVAGVYFQTHLFQKNKPRNLLHSKLEKQYSAVMMGKKATAQTADIVKKLLGELRRIEAVKSSQLSAAGEEAITAKLALVLEAFNKCAAQTSLNIDSILITSRTIRITGDTSSRENTLKLRKAIEEGNLKISQDNLELKGGRDVFSITVVPKKK